MTIRVAVIACAALCATAEEYKLGPDSERRSGVPQGTVTAHKWSSSSVFPGTVRDYWVYVPAQYKADKPAAVMIFQDGGGFVREGSAWRTPIVFDNLIEKGEMPVTIGIFIDPGVLPAPSSQAQSRFNRSYEYDGLGDRYARFLADEILPEVGKRLKLSTDPNDYALAGSSSGGIAAFTAAWNRPDKFRRVMSFIGSYTNLRGGDTYINLVRKMEPKPLRVFLQDGRNDQNLYSGSWWHANESLAASLEYAGYESTFVAGTEGHNSKHGSAILPDALRWLWKGHPAPVRKAHAPGKGERHYVTEILDPESDWQLVSKGHQFAEGSAVDKDGSVYFCDAANRIHRVSPDGTVKEFRKSDGAGGLMFGADGTLYAAQKTNVVAWSADGTQRVVAAGVEANDLAAGARGELYFSEPRTHSVWYVGPDGSRKLVHKGLESPKGVRFSPDGSLLLVSDYANRYVWSFAVQPDGSLTHGQPFYRLEIDDSDPLKPTQSAAHGMTLDTEGYLYVGTNTGIQICDQPGRVVAVIRKPTPGNPTNLVFGGAGLDWLYATTSDGEVWRRHLRRKGFLPWNRLTPPRPRL